MNTTVTRQALAWIAIALGLAVAQAAVLAQVSQAFQVVGSSVGADSKDAEPEAEARGSEADLQSIEKVERERRIIVDASKSGGGWWFPQRRDFRRDQPHQGKVLADYLRSRGCEVIELPRRTVLDDQLKGADMVIRVSNYSTYSEAELQAYRDYVATGGSLLLVGGAANPRAAPDAVANAFGIEISDVLSRVRVTRWAEVPYLRQLPFMTLMRGGRISRSPKEFIPWGWDASNNLIVGSMAYGKGKVVALSTD